MCSHWKGKSLLITFVITTFTITVTNAYTWEIKSMNDSGRPGFQTFIIFYTDALTEENTINCSFPSFDHQNSVRQWIAPSGVPIVTLAGNDTLGSVRSVRKKPNVPWVELTPDNSLIFHNPDDSVSGAYTCRILEDDDLVFQTVVWVHVLRKSVFDIGLRFKIAFLVVGVFLAIIICSWAICWYKKKRVRHSMSRCQEDFVDVDKTQVVYIPSQHE